MKTCSKCGISFTNGKGKQCLDCWNAYRRDWRARGGGNAKPKTKEQARRDTLFYRYGLTPERYEEILRAQGGTCATCPASPEDSTRAFHIDHDHSCCAQNRKTCGLCVRGILCHNCNSALGHAKDDVETLKNLVKYLESARL